jgi:hypothetical protein
MIDAYDKAMLSGEIKLPDDLFEIAPIARKIAVALAKCNDLDQPQTSVESK